MANYLQWTGNNERSILKKDLTLKTKGNSSSN